MRRPTPLCSIAAAALIAACGDAGNTDQQPDTRRAQEPAASTTPADNMPSNTATSRGESGGTVPIEITAVIDGRNYRAAGTGECTHTGEASIYGVRAAQWRASYSGTDDGVRSLNLTIWQPAAGGADQANLAVSAGGRTHRIATVQGGQVVGEAVATVAGGAAAGTLTVEGEDADGATLRVTVECARFDVPVAEGG